MGDLSEIIEKHGCRNEKRQRLIDFAVEKHLESKYIFQEEKKKKNLEISALAFKYETNFILSSTIFIKI